MKIWRLLLTALGVAAFAAPALAHTERGARGEGETGIALRAEPPVFLPAVPGISSAVASAKMSGWTVLVDGVTKGNGTLASVGASNVLVIRGNNDVIYAAVLPSEAPALITQPLWRALLSGAKSDPNCAGAGIILGCVYLTDGGKPAYSIIRADAGPMYSLATGMLGGESGGFAPTIVAGPTAFIAGKNDFYFDLALWNGKGTLASRRVGARFMGQYTVELNLGDLGKWSALGMPAFGPVGCADHRCAMVTGNQRILMLTIGEPGDKPVMEVPAPTLPGGTSGRPSVAKINDSTYVVVVRADAGGKIHQITYDGANKKFIGTWVDEGGSAIAGTSPSCTAQKGKAICSIQGVDGRIYGKVLSATGL